MRKIPSLFKRNYETDRLVRDEVVPGCEWVLAGEGVPTRKWDGTCCLVRNGKLLKRYTLRRGKRAPEGFEAATPIDPKTGKQEGWVPVSHDSPEDRWHREAATDAYLHEGSTYELCGPKINGNPECLVEHVIIRHGREILNDNRVGRTYTDIKLFLARNLYMEGIVWHHPDGRMAKIKAKDFGIQRPSRWKA